MLKNIIKNNLKYLGIKKNEQSIEIKKTVNIKEKIVLKSNYKQTQQHHFDNQISPVQILHVKEKIFK